MSAESLLETQGKLSPSTFIKWLNDDPEVVVAAGAHPRATMLPESVLANRRGLLPERQEGWVRGVRDLRVKGYPHNVHDDLERVGQVAL
jgi:hypothetical protein